jgi:glycosyltransferase involved in cell wall biosynthesis
MNKGLTYLTHGYAVPDQVSSGASTRHYYHIRELLDNGRTVYLITSNQSTVSDESTLEHENHESENLIIDYINLPGIKKNSIVVRMNYHLQYMFKTFWKSWKAPPTSIVVASVPTILVGLIASFVAMKNNARLVIDVRDLWTESLSTTSLSKIPFFLKFNLWMESFVYNRAAAICCTSQAQAETVKSLLKRNIPVSLVPNGIDPVIDDNVEINPFIREVREKHGKVVLFAGKHSNYTDLDNVISAAKLLNDREFAIVLLGGGYTKKGLVKRVVEEKIQNVYFHDPVPKSQVAGFEAGADIFLINYSPEKAWAKVLPNKVFDYLFWNKPVIAAVTPGEISKILEESGSGVRVDPGNPDALAKAIFNHETIQSRKDSREYILDNYDRKQTVKQFYKMIELVGYNFEAL